MRIYGGNRGDRGGIGAELGNSAGYGYVEGQGRRGRGRGESDGTGGHMVPDTGQEGQCSLMPAMGSTS